jgi:hypothetical protein
MLENMDNFNPFSEEFLKMLREDADFPFYKEMEIVKEKFSFKWRLNTVNGKDVTIKERISSSLAPSPEVIKNSVKHGDLYFLFWALTEIIKWAFAIENHFGEKIRTINSFEALNLIYNKKPLLLRDLLRESGLEWFRLCDLYAGIFINDIIRYSRIKSDESRGNLLNVVKSATLSFESYNAENRLGNMLTSFNKMEDDFVMEKEVDILTKIASDRIEIIATERQYRSKGGKNKKPKRKKEALKYYAENREEFKNDTQAAKSIYDHLETINFGEESKFNSRESGIRTIRNWLRSETEPDGSYEYLVKTVMNPQQTCGFLRKKLRRYFEDDEDLASSKTLRFV